MKERKATAIILQTTAQIVPAADFVDGFVADELFEQRGGRVPIDPRDAQESGIKPRLQQVMKIVIHLLEFAIFRQRIQQSLAHADDDARAAGCTIEPPQQLLAGWFSRVRECGQMVAVWRNCVCRCRGQNCLRVGRKFAFQRPKEGELMFFRQVRVQRQRVLRQRNTGRLASL